MKISLKLQIADICRRLYHTGHVVATSGNISIRKKNGFFITPTMTRKDSVTAGKIIECAINGKPKRGKPSIEVPMHREIYLKRPDVGAAIHSHSPYCLVCSLAGIPIDDKLLPELVCYIGKIFSAAYATPGTEEMAKAISPHLAGCNAFFLEHHGVLVLGTDIWDAFNRLEHLEHVARISYLVHLAKGNK